MHIYSNRRANNTDVMKKYVSMYWIESIRINYNIIASVSSSSNMRTACTLLHDHHKLVTSQLKTISPQTKETTTLPAIFFNISPTPIDLALGSSLMETRSRSGLKTHNWIDFRTMRSKLLCSLCYIPSAVPAYGLCTLLGISVWAGVWV